MADYLFVMVDDKFRHYKDMSKYHNSSLNATFTLKDRFNLGESLHFF